MLTSFKVVLVLVIDLGIVLIVDCLREHLAQIVGIEISARNLGRRRLATSTRRHLATSFCRRLLICARRCLFLPAIVICDF